MDDLDALAHGEVPGNPGDFAIRAPVPRDLVDSGAWRLAAVSVWHKEAYRSGCTASEPHTVELTDRTWCGMPVAEVVGPAWVEQPWARQRMNP